MNTAALIVAAGRGHRAGGELPKQYRMLGGQTVLARTLESFLSHNLISFVQVVVHAEDEALYTNAVNGLANNRLLPPVHGGADRQASVHAGLEALAADPPDAVLIHDAARPFLSPELTGRVVEALHSAEAVLPALPIVDALWRSDGGKATDAVPREDLWRAQTPQGFAFPAILDLHRKAAPGAPDDVTLARIAGLDVAIVMGDGNNFKITLAEDFTRGETLLARQEG